MIRYRIKNIGSDNEIRANGLVWEVQQVKDEDVTTLCYCEDIHRAETIVRSLEFLERYG